MIIATPIKAIPMPIGITILLFNPATVGLKSEVRGVSSTVNDFTMGGLATDGSNNHG
jgi:hypothetical protein